MTAIAEMVAIATLPKHVQVAATEGMKAGYRQFSTVASKSGLPTVKRAWRPYKALNSKGRFNLYCSQFGPTVESLGVPTAGATRASVVDERTSPKIQALLELKAELLAEIDREIESLSNEGVQAFEDEAKPAAKRKPRKATTSKDDPSTFSAAVVARKGLPTKVGKTFTYQGKRGSSKWVVVGSTKAGITAVRAA